MTTIPRFRQTTDHELLVMGRICDLLATLTKDGQGRVIGYILQRKDSLPVAAAGAANGADAGAEEAGELFAPQAA